MVGAGRAAVVSQTMRTTLFLFLPMLFHACVGPGPVDGDPDNDAFPPMDSTFIGEYRLVDGVGRLRLCGEWEERNVLGAGADSLELVCALTRTTQGQRTKVWVEGRIAMDEGEGKEAPLLVSKVLHHAAALRCPVMPLPELSGRYEGDLPGLQKDARTMVLDLFLDGSAFTAAPDVEHGRMAEDEGTWGVDGDGIVEVTWPARDIKHRYRHAQGGLFFQDDRMTSGGLVLQRQGDAQRLWGTHGEVMQLIAGLSTQQGRPLDASEIDAHAGLQVLFPGGSDREALNAAVTALVGGEHRGWERDLALAATPAELVLLVRRYRPRSAS